jgi:uncharacterized membrane protein YedE/YeeE
MNELQLAQLQWTVLAATAFVSLFLGVLLHRSHFCTMGAVSDMVVMENFDRLRQWALALAVAVFGFACMTYAGPINPLQSMYATKDLLWLSTLLGGLLFGWGMVWASGSGEAGRRQFEILVCFACHGPCSAFGHERCIGRCESPIH